MNQFINEPTGYLYIGDGVAIAYYHKLPSKFHRYMQRIFFGFRWEENKKHKGDTEC